MGVLPLQFQSGETRETLNLTGEETFDITVDDSLEALQDVPVKATRPDGSTVEFTVTCRIDTDEIGVHSVRASWALSALCASDECSSNLFYSPYTEALRSKRPGWHATRNSLDASTKERLMFRRFAFIACLLITLPVHANDRPVFERVTDGVGFALTSGAFMASAGLVGGLFGWLACEDDCGDSLTSDIVVGGLVGFVGGGLIFDGLSDGDGSHWGAAGGAGLGALGGLGLAALIDDDRSLAMTAGGMVIGGGLGYALVDAPSVTPTVSVVPDGKGGQRSTFGLSGRF
jgi:hypothetical protein